MSTKKIKVQKIEIDKQNKPKIVSCTKADVKTKIPPEEETEEDYAKELGKQVVMRQVFGFDIDGTGKISRQRLIKNIFAFLFVLSVVAVLCWTAYNDFFSPHARKNPISFSELGKTLGNNWIYIVLCIFALLLCFFLKGFKMSLMCRSLTKKWKLGTCIETGIVGHYYNYITPLGAGGQPFEIYYLSKHGIGGGVGASLPIASYFMYQFATVSVTLFSLLTFKPNVNLFSLPEHIILSNTADVIRPLALVGLIFGLLLPALVILFSILPRLCGKLVGFIMFLGEKLKLIKDKKLLTYKTLKTVTTNAKCLKHIAKNPLVFISSYLLSLLEFLSQCSIAFFTLKFFGFSSISGNGLLEMAQVLQVCILLYSAVSFIPTPGNSGAADLSFYWLFSEATAFAFPAMISWRILSYYSYIFIGFGFTTTKRKLDKKRKKQLK